MKNNKKKDGGNLMFLGVLAALTVGGLAIWKRQQDAGEPGPAAAVMPPSTGTGGAVVAPSTSPFGGSYPGVESASWYYTGPGSILAPSAPVRPLVISGGMVATAGGGGTTSPTMSYDSTNNSGAPAFGVSLAGRF